MYNGKLAEEIIKNVGGKENIISAEHCATRLRLLNTNHGSFEGCR